MQEFTNLVELMASLRGEEGCPWDKKQTEKAFKTFLLEEVYELIDAIDSEDPGALKEELGDLLFHIVFIARICEEKKQFDVKEVVASIYEKMYKRHPHVFSKARDGKTVEARWEELKREEKGDKGYSPVFHVPKVLPALLRAYEVSKRAARTGFDWENLDDIYLKIHEEVEELKSAQSAGTRDEIEEEIGDLLFTVVNVARYQGIDPENALRRTIDKFLRRFGYIERHHDMTNPDLRAMDALWNETKKKEKKGK